MINLISDTVTQPTRAMLESMMKAEVGDDVFGADPTIQALQDKAAQLFGMEAALFCPSGTMTNQIAINVHTQPGDEVICSYQSHIYNYEGGGIARLSGSSVKLIGNDDGFFTAEEVVAGIHPGDAHYAHTALVSIENTTNRGGGKCWDLKEVAKIAAVCREHELAFHLDGARIFNAIVARKENPEDYGKWFDSISICLSKGLGAPVGSLLMGSRDLIAKAHRVRKVLGGGMRQAGYLAAAGIYALDHHVYRLEKDHDLALRLAKAITDAPYVTKVVQPETNILLFDTEIPANEYAEKLKEIGILVIPFGPNRIRMTTHLGVDTADIDQVIEKVKNLS